ncbi:MAG: hypothetical protein ABR564_03180 [Candidatus Dormibacteria bacterium]
MPAPSTRRVTVYTPLLAALCGALLGLAVFALSAALWRAGETRLAALSAEGSLMLALTSLAAFVLLARPPLPRRVRVLSRQPTPHELRSSDLDPVPVLAICAGAPLMMGVAAAVVLFH